MKDPYEVLGVSPQATDDEVKTAYRNLAKKYHPDRLQNNPLADLAAEKMKEINDAHDLIQKERKEGIRPSGGPGNYHAGGQRSRNPIYQEVRAAIERREFYTATTLLNHMVNRDAEWYFLTASVAYASGWLDEARQGFVRAVEMDPANPEYQQALLMFQRQGHAGGANTYSSGCCGPCDCCTSWLCFNLCCPCC
ncbi:MAG: J domain-containing protein [Eubacteriales bacterium]